MVETVQPLVAGTFIMPPAPQLMAMRGDARLIGLKNISEKERRAFEPPETRVLEPEVPPTIGKSRFVIVEEDFASIQPVETPFSEFQFVEQPEELMRHDRFGGGLGFDFITGRHRVRAKMKANADGPFLWAGLNRPYLIASPDVVELMKKFGVEDLAVLQIDFTDDTDAAARGFLFVDTTRCLDAYDYTRSAAVFQQEDGKLFAHLGQRRSFQDIDGALHLFHDLYDRPRFIMSRMLWKHLVASGVRGFSALDPANMGDAQIWEDAVREGGVR